MITNNKHLLILIDSKIFCQRPDQELYPQASAYFSDIRWNYLHHQMGWGLFLYIHLAVCAGCLLGMFVGLKLTVLCQFSIIPYLTTVFLTC